MLGLCFRFGDIKNPYTFSANGDCGTDIIQPAISMFPRGGGQVLVSAFHTFQDRFLNHYISIFCVSSSNFVVDNPTYFFRTAYSYLIAKLAEEPDDWIPYLYYLNPLAHDTRSRSTLPFKVLISVFI